MLPEPLRRNKLTEEQRFEKSQPRGWLFFFDSDRIHRILRSAFMGTYIPSTLEMVPKTEPTMASRLIPPGIITAITVSILFIGNLSYTGAGFNLHRLSLAGLLLFLWLATSIVKLDFARIHFAGGWLPAVAIAYIGWLLFAAPLLSTYPYATSTTAMSLAALPLALVGWLLLPNANKPRAWQLTYQSLLLIVLVLAIWGITDLVVANRRAHAVFLDPNAYAALINLFLVPLIYTYLNSADRPSARINRAVPMLMIAILTAAQSMSLSRGALLSFLIVLPVIFWLSRFSPVFRSRSLKLLAVLLSIHLLVNISPFSRQQGVDAVLFEPQQYTQSNSVQDRVLLLDSAWKMIRHVNPLIGSGLGTFKTYYSAYRDADEDSLGNFVHNDYVQGLQEGGVIQLAFFVILTVFAPLWILYKQRRRTPPAESPSSANVEQSFMLGILCISIHALVNFIHYVGPIALITGLYLGRAWESTRSQRPVQLLSYVGPHLKPRYLKAIIILLLAAPTAVLVVDGIIFKLFATDNSIHARMQPEARVRALNLALAIRPGNPLPRILLIRSLLSAAEKADDSEDRTALLSQAERETKLLSAQAPALAIGKYFFPGKIAALRAGPGDLERARDDLEHAVRLVPAATGMRLELVKVYLKLGETERAYRSIQDAKQWIRLEVDRSALLAFTAEAQLVALDRRDADEAMYWKNLHDRLERRVPAS